MKVSAHLYISITATDNGLKALNEMNNKKSRIRKIKK